MLLFSKSLLPRLLRFSPLITGKAAQCCSVGSQLGLTSALADPWGTCVGLGCRSPPWMGCWGLLWCFLLGSKAVLPLVVPVLAQVVLPCPGWMLLLAGVVLSPCLHPPPVPPAQRAVASYPLDAACGGNAWLVWHGKGALSSTYRVKSVIVVPLSPVHVQTRMPKGERPLAPTPGRQDGAVSQRGFPLVGFLSTNVFYHYRY